MAETTVAVSALAIFEVDSAAAGGRGHNEPRHVSAAVRHRAETGLNPRAINAGYPGRRWRLTPRRLPGLIAEACRQRREGYFSASSAPLPVLIAGSNLKRFSTDPASVGR